MTEINDKNLTSLQRIDPACNRIVDKGSHTALYKFITATRSWEKTDISGSMFLYQRCDKPFYSLIIVNRQTPNDFIEPIAPNMEVNTDKQFLFLKKADGDIKCLWFFKEDECSRLAKTIKGLIEDLKVRNSPNRPASPEVASTAESSAVSIDVSDLFKRSGPKTNSGNSNDSEKEGTPNKRPLSLISLAGSAISQTNSEKVQSPMGAAPPLTELPVALQKLMAQEHTSNFVKTGTSEVTVVSADELEKNLVKDLAKSAKPKHNFQEFLNSSSAVSIAAMSTRSVHGSEGVENDNVEVESTTSARPPLEDVSFAVGSASGMNTPPLNKSQFVSALVNLLDTDDVFVAQLHQAYADAINRRLNLNA